MLSIDCNLVDNAADGKIIYSSRIVRISKMLKTGLTSDLIRLALLIFIGLPLVDVLF